MKVLYKIRKTSKIPSKNIFKQVTNRILKVLK